VLYVGGYGVNADEVRAAQLFSEGCAGGNGDACHQLGVFHAHGRGGYPADPRVALEFFEKSCRSGNGPVEACTADVKFKRTGQLP
jgi:TPR repeat protein